MDRPRVFQFYQAIDYLKELLSYLKDQQKLSMRKVAGMVRISPSMLSMILKGERKITSELAEGLGKIAGLNKDELQYLNILVEFSNEKSIEALNKLSVRNESPSNQEAFEYLTKWHHVAIREMSKLQDFDSSGKWIQNRLISEVSIKEIKNSISFLIKAGFLEFGPGRKSLKTNKSLLCDEDVHRLSLGQFHSQMLGLADESIGRVQRDKRLIMGHTEALSEEQFLEAQEIIKEAINKIKNLSEKGEVNGQVYHFELAAFPLTKGN